MLNDASGFSKIYLAVGYTDLRKGIDGLAGIVRQQFQLDPFQKNVVFLFCGKRCDRMKALCWEGDGFVVAYKRLECAGTFKWPRTSSELKELSDEQFRMLMQGFEVFPKRPIREICPPKEPL